MKYIKKFEQLNIQKFKIGDYVKLINTSYFIATICRINNCNLDTIFKITDYNELQNNGDESDNPYQISLNNEFNDHIWVDEKSLKLAPEEEVEALKYNL